MNSKQQVSSVISNSIGEENCRWQTQGSNQNWPIIKNKKPQSGSTTQNIKWNLTRSNWLWMTFSKGSTQGKSRNGAYSFGRTWSHNSTQLSISKQKRVHADVLPENTTSTTYCHTYYYVVIMCRRGQKNYDTCRIRTYAGEPQKISNLSP